jgi:hypothetical protein
MALAVPVGTLSSVGIAALEARERFFALNAPQVARFRATVPYNLVTKLQILPASLTRALFPRFSLLE